MQMKTVVKDFTAPSPTPIKKASLSLDSDNASLATVKILP